MTARSHQTIINDAGGAHALAKSLHDQTGGELVKLQKRVRAWHITDSIPGEYWQLLATLGIATLAELAAHADARREMRPERRRPSRSEASAI